MDGPSQPRRSERIATRVVKVKESQNPSPSPPPPPSQRSRATKRVAAKNSLSSQNAAADKPKAPAGSRTRAQTKGATISPNSQKTSAAATPAKQPPKRVAKKAVAPPPQPRSIKKPPTPRSPVQKHIVMRRLGTSPLDFDASSPQMSSLGAQPGRKRAARDSAQAPPAKRIRLGPQQILSSPTPLPHLTQPVVSPTTGETILSPIAVRKTAPAARRSPLTGAALATEQAQQRKASEELRRQVTAFHLQPPGPNGGGATAPHGFRFPENRPIVPQSAKMVRIEAWLKVVESHRPRNNIYIAPPIPPSSLPTISNTGHAATQPKNQQSSPQNTSQNVPPKAPQAAPQTAPQPAPQTTPQRAPQNVPARRPSGVEIITVPSSYEYEYDYSYAYDSTPGEGGTEYQSAEERLPHQQAHVKDEYAKEVTGTYDSAEQPEKATQKAQRTFDMLRALIYKSRDERSRARGVEVAVHRLGVDGSGGTQPTQ